MPCRRGCVLTRGARADDVLKARLKTTGVVEHKFTLAKGTEFKGVEWVIYDVGGARSQRQAWAPYFDDGASLRVPFLLFAFSWLPRLYG